MKVFSVLVLATLVSGCATGGHFSETKTITIWPGIVIETTAYGYGEPTPPQQKVEPVKWSMPGASGIWGQGITANCPTGTIHGPQYPTAQNGGQVWKHQPIGGCSGRK